MPVAAIVPVLLPGAYDTGNGDFCIRVVHSDPEPYLVVPSRWYTPLYLPKIPGSGLVLPAKFSSTICRS